MASERGLAVSDILELIYNLVAACEIGDEAIIAQAEQAVAEALCEEGAVIAAVFTQRFKEQAAGQRFVALGDQVVRIPAA